MTGEAGSASSLPPSVAISFLLLPIAVNEPGKSSETFL